MPHNEIRDGEYLIDLPHQLRVIIDVSFPAGKVPCGNDVRLGGAENLPTKTDNRIELSLNCPTRIITQAEPVLFGLFHVIEDFNIE